MTDRILRAGAVVKLVGLSRTTIWRMERAGEFPLRRKISQGTVGWLESEVMQWMTEREKVQGTYLRI